MKSPICKFKQLKIFIAAMVLTLLMSFAGEVFARECEPPCDGNGDGRRGGGGSGSSGIINPALEGDLGSGEAGDIFGRYIGAWWGTAYLAGGVIFIIYLVWGGIEWIVSGSNEERVTNAKNKITNALIGLVLLAGSWTLIKAVGYMLGLGILENLKQGLDVLAP